MNALREFALRGIEVLAALLLLNCLSGKPFSRADQILPSAIAVLTVGMSVCAMRRWSLSRT